MESIIQDKERGNDAFKSGRINDALMCYTDGLGKIKSASEETKDIQVVLYQNRAACKLKEEDYQGAIEDCTKALQIDGNSVKALFRRAQAYTALKQVENAFKDLTLLMQLDKDNAAGTKLIQQVRVLAQEQNSTTTQTLDMVSSVYKGEGSQVDREGKLRHVLGAIMEDHQLAYAIALKGVCEQLWTVRTSDPISLKVLSKLCEFERCTPMVLKAVCFPEIKDIINAKDEHTGKPACLNIAWRLFLFDAEHEKSMDSGVIMGLIVSSLNSDDEALRRIAIEGSVRVCTDNQERSKSFIQHGGLEALMSVLNRDLNRDEPLQQVSVVLGQVLPALKDDDEIKNIALGFCKPNLSSADVFNQIRGTSALNAIFFANRDLGLALVSEDGLLELLHRIARSGADRAQALATEIFSHMANSENGRTLLGGDITDLLKLLVTSDCGPVRSAAAVTLAKLNAIDFNAESENGMLVLSSVVHLLQNKGSKEEHAKGVEAVSFVITDSNVKNMIAQGKGIEILEELIQLAGREKSNAKEAYAYGLAYIFENITMSQDDKRREKLREMEVTEEQWEQFEKLTKSQTRKPGQEDPRENVEMRIQTFVQTDGIAALRALVLNGGGERVLDSVARTFVNIASVQAVRSAMLTQGAHTALFKLTKIGSEKAKSWAAHALAKIFITTDPHVLKDEQLMDGIAPLIREVRHSDEELVVFECCMALTNIAVVSFEAKQQLVNRKAIQAFEYAQYSDNLMIRRAATEALNNLIPTEEFTEWICIPEKMKLWILFAQSYEEDVPTASAATGALANLGSDPRVAEAVAKQDDNALEKIVGLASCGNLDIEYRAIVCLSGLLESWPEGGGKEALKAAGAEAAAANIVKQYPSSPPSEAAQELLQALR
uniref:Protein unc-45 homolog B n=1 Tax=Mucochytrium quahogii TaxID=96639 RepID=A0A7S2RU75_9STRA|mmetsp:Transcript_3314/g.6223  ORF Transcript_3314/g.6223 Transcript_3314/m.6223 type:complete len:886 (+) Transcript_3314:59-2716(+)